MRELRTGILAILVGFEEGGGAGGWIWESVVYK